MIYSGFGNSTRVIPIYLSYLLLLTFIITAQSAGILVAQLGSGRSLDDPPEDHSIDRFRKKYLDGLFDAGFEAIREYTEVCMDFMGLTRLA